MSGEMSPAAAPYVRPDTPVYDEFLVGGNGGEGWS